MYGNYNGSLNNPTSALSDSRLHYSNFPNEVYWLLNKPIKSNIPNWLFSLWVCRDICSWGESLCSSQTSEPSSTRTDWRPRRWLQRCAVPAGLAQYTGWTTNTALWVAASGNPWFWGASKECLYSNRQSGRWVNSRLSGERGGWDGRW